MATVHNNEQWAIVELMGHQKIAGRYSENGPMHRIDVPDDDGFRFSRLYSPQAIYSITFVDEQTARMAAQAFDTPAITIWEVQREIKRLAALAARNEPVEGAYEAEYPDDYEDEFDNGPDF